MPITSSISGARSTVCGIELELAGLDLGEVQHLVDEAEQVGAGAMHALERFQRLFGAEARRVGDHHLGQPDDGVERRAQLVAHAGDELRLVLARLLQAGGSCPGFRRTAARSRSRSRPGRRRSSSSICLSVNGGTSRRDQHHHADRESLAQSGTPSNVRKPPLPRLDQLIFRIGLHIVDMDRLAFESARPTTVPPSARRQAYFAIMSIVWREAVAGNAMEECRPSATGSPVSASQSCAANSTSVSSTV